MSERETRTFETPVDKVKITINAFMTGGEMMDLEGVAVGSGVKSVDGRSGEITMRAEEAYKKRLRKLVDIMVVSVGEIKGLDDNWNAIRALKGQDYSFAMNAIEASASGLTPDEGKA